MDVETGGPMQRSETVGVVLTSGLSGNAVARLLEIAAFLLGYLLLEWLSDLHEYRGIPVTPWNPGLGLIFGLMVLRGPAYAALLAIGYFLAEQVVIGGRMPPLMIATIAVEVGIGYGLAALAARRWLRIDRDLERLSDIAGLMACGLAGAALSVGLVGVSLLAAGNWSPADLTATLLSLFVGDAIGIAIAAPIVLRLARRLRSAGSLRAWLPTADMIVIAAIILLLLAAMHVWLGRDSTRFIFVLVAPIVLAAVRDGLDGASFSLMVTQFGLILILNATGLDARAYTEVQAEMLVLTMAGLTVGAVVSERAALSGLAAQTARRLKALQTEAQQAGRISLVGGMSSVLAHEINQPITAARALARSAQHLIRAETPDIERASRNLDTMVTQIDHAAKIISRMREFLRRGQPHVSTIDVSAMMQNTVSLARMEVEASDIALNIVVPPSLPPLFGDRTQIEQVLLNLIRNACDSLRSAGVRHAIVEVGVSTQEGGLEFHVRDNGPGVPEHQRAGLFDPIHTEKPERLGLGLAISAFIVQNHRGRIWLAESRPGWTEFRFSIPLDAG